MDNERKCFLCGETNEIVLDEHHLIPENIQEKMGITNDEKEILCSNCHKKVHYLLRPIERIIVGSIQPEELEEIEMEEKPYEELSTILMNQEKTKQLMDKLIEVIKGLEIQLQGYPIPVELIVKKAAKQNISEDFVEWGLLALQKTLQIERPAKRFVISKYDAFGPIVAAMIKEEERKVETILDLLRTLEERSGKPVPLEALIERAALENIDAAFVNRTLGQLKGDGIVFEPKPGFLKRV